MLALFLVCCVLFLSCFVLFLVLLSQTVKSCFPCNSSVFQSCCLQSSFTCFFFSFRFLFVFVVFSCVVCFHFGHLICIILWLCCLVFSLKNRTKWFCCLHFVVFIPFCCFVLNFVFFHSSKKRPPKNGHSKNPRNQKYRKKDKHKKSVSAAVFTDSVPNFWGVGYKNVIFAESPIIIGVWAYFEKGKRAKNVKTVELKICPRLSWKSVQSCCAT